MGIVIQWKTLRMKITLVFLAIVGLALGAPKDLDEKEFEKEFNEKFEDKHMEKDAADILEEDEAQIDEENENLKTVRLITAKSFNHGLMNQKKNLKKKRKVLFLLTKVETKVVLNGMDITGV